MQISRQQGSHLQGLEGRGLAVLLHEASYEGSCSWQGCSAATGLALGMLRPLVAMVLAGAARQRLCLHACLKVTVLACTGTGLLDRAYMQVRRGGCGSCSQMHACMSVPCPAGKQSAQHLRIRVPAILKQLAPAAATALTCMQ